MIIKTSINNTLADLRAIERTLDDGAAYVVRQAINTLALVAAERDEALKVQSEYRLAIAKATEVQS